MVNVSEGRDGQLVDRLAGACGTALLDTHSDPHHNRTVFTLGGPGDMVERATRTLVTAALAALDFTEHHGEHPAFGVVDVVPFVPLQRSGYRASGSDDGVRAPAPLAVAPPLAAAVAARDRFARWAGSGLGLPCYRYGPLPPGGHRTLPEVRRHAGHCLPPDTGPAKPHPRGGRCAVGARHFLVAYNMWMEGGDVALARAVAAEIRGPAVRALGFDLGGRAQVSCNLVDPLTVGPGRVHDEVARSLERAGAGVARCELVGLLPAEVLAAVPPGRWESLGLSPEQTVEARLEEAGNWWD